MKSEESRKRIAALRALLEQAGVECAVVGPTTTMRYLVGYAPHADERLCLLLLDAQDAQLVVPEVNAEATAEQVEIGLLRWADEQGPAEALERSLLAGRRPGRLAVDGAMRSDFLLPLLPLCRPDRVVSLESIVAPLRMVKSPGEVDALAAAAAQADRAMLSAVGACRPGVAEQDIAWAAEEAFRRDGAEKVEFTLVAAGAHAALPHHATGSRVLKSGEGVILDMGASLGGYKSDITRVVHLGRPGPEFVRVYDTVRRANEAGLAAVRPGVTAGGVDEVVRSVIEAAGYGPLFVHRTGHGLGLDIHEPPWIMAGQETRLESGMVFSVEPGIYLPGRFGVRLEDIVVVEPGGARVLTGLSHDLIIR